MIVRLRRWSLLLAILVSSPAWPATSGAAGERQREAPFARVGETVISQQQYHQALHRTVRGRYYHGSIPEGQAAAVRREVAEGVIERVLLLQEAARLGIEADGEAVASRIQAYEARYARSPGWDARRETALPALRAHLEEESVLERLRERLYTVGTPTQGDLLGFYREHPDLFTEPARQRASLILLAVDPSSPAETWQAAFSEAAGLVAEIRAGADFAEMARRHSDDRTAAAGGDMGYLHRGMLSEAAESALADLGPGEVSDPLRVLEGVAILRVEERIDARLMPFDQIRDRARALWARERGDEAWTALKERLRDETQIIVYDQTLSEDDGP